MAAHIRLVAGMRSGRRGAKSAVIAAFAFTVLYAPEPVFAGDGNGCIGDCGVDGQLTVEEVVTMVNIALGSALLSACPQGDANGDGRITVDEILIALTHALTGCPTTSDFFGLWHSRDADLVRSNCGGLFDSIIGIALGLQAPCAFNVMAAAGGTTVINCNEVQFSGGIDESGVLEVQSSISDPEPPCSFSSTADLSVDLSRSPTEATFVIDISVARQCPIGNNCSLEFRSTWSR